MENYAKIIDGIVENVIVATAEFIAEQTDALYVLSTDENPACVGGLYIDGKFTLPQPYPSWTIDENLVWQPPVPAPNDGNYYAWNDENQTWVEV